MEYIPIIIQGVIALFFTIVTWKVKSYLSEVETRDKAMQEKLEVEKERIEQMRLASCKGTQALLRDRLLQGYHFFMKRGSVTYGEASSYSNMYNAYHNLGKNGVMDDIYKNFRTIPVKTDAEVYPHEPSLTAKSNNFTSTSTYDSSFINEGDNI